MGRQKVATSLKDAVVKSRARMSEGDGATSDEAVATELDAEDIVTMQIGAPGKMEQLADFRREIVRIYRLACNGKIPVSLATKAVWLVDRARVAKLNEEQLLLAQKGGGGDQPFTGMTILPPAKTEAT